MDRRLSGNDVLILDDPQTVWVIERGSLAVFGTSRGGRRRTFFTCRTGEALFGLDCQGGPAQPTLAAVALGESVLRRAEAGEAADGLARAWVGHWGAALDGLPVESVATLEEFQEALSSRLAQALTDEPDGEPGGPDGEQAERELTHRALDSLSSVLLPSTERLPEGPPLFVAAAAVAAAGGFRLRHPPDWDAATAAADPVEVIARASHVRVRRVLLADRWWEQRCGALLAFRAPDHRPVALLPARDGRYELLDPAQRGRVRLDARVAATLEPQAWTFYRPLGDGRIGALDLARFALGGRGPDLLAIFATAAAATLLGMVVPAATGLLIDLAIPDADVPLLGQLAGALLAATLGGTAFRLAQGLAMTRLESGADAVTQPAVWDRLLSLQLAFFRRFASGDLLSRVTAVSQIRAYFGGSTLRTVFSSVVALVNLVLLLAYSPRLTLVALGVAAAGALLTALSGALLVRLTRRVLELRGRFFGLMVQMINGIPKLRVAAAEERAFARWAPDYAELTRLELRQGRMQDAVTILNILLGAAGTVVLFAAAGSDPGLTTGAFLAFNVAFGTFVAATAGLSNTVTDVLNVAVLYERARPILEAVPEATARQADPGALAGRVELESVSFRYQPEGPLILDDVSLRAEPGQFIAIVGPSGSGKSTLLRLLLGFETPASGSVTYDGQDLATLDVHAVRRQMGVVLQAGRINAGSIFENIVCGTQRTLAEALAAARDVGFADDIAAMPMGLHTVVSEGGTNLSGGQRQRLLLARALVHSPRILLLDEATSALDNRTQAIVAESLERLDVTRIVIAHRLSTIRSAARIYVLEAGRVVERGSYDELASGGGLFARLMARQLE